MVGHLQEKKKKMLVILMLQLPNISQKTVHIYQKTEPGIVLPKINCSFTHPHIAPNLCFFSVEHAIDTPLTFFVKSYRYEMVNR